MLKGFLSDLPIILPLWFLATALSALVYGAVQQNYRQSANDPQIQMAEDSAKILSSGIPAASVVGLVKVNPADSLAPFLIVYEEAGKTVASSAILNGQTPTPPPGVFDFVRKNGEESLTWEPSPEVRVASVVRHLTASAGGFVLAGRSLREVEIRENRLTTMVFFAWLIAIIGVVATFWAARYSERFLKL